MEEEDDIYYNELLDMWKENQVLKNNIENITKTTEDEMHSKDEEIATALI